jgi:hypothetical protein
MTARYGYGPNGRALKKDGTERAARRTLSPEEKIAQLAEMEAKAYGGIGKKILSGSEDMSGFNSGLAIFKGWVREARAVADEDKREARRAYLQAQIDALDSKGAVAAEFLPGAGEAIEVVNGLYSRIGKGYQALVNSGEATPDNVAAMIREQISDDVLEIVESANDPDSDPFGEFRRGAGEEDTEEDDTL